MLAAHAIRVIKPDRVVVMLEGTRSVVELQLSQPMGPEQLAKARSLMSPLRPVPVLVTPGSYHAGVFWDSEMENLRFSTVVRPRVKYGRAAVKRGSNQGSI